MAQKITLTSRVKDLEALVKSLVDKIGLLEQKLKNEKTEQSYNIPELDKESKLENYDLFGEKTPDEILGLAKAKPFLHGDVPLDRRGNPVGNWKRDKNELVLLEPDNMTEIRRVPVSELAANS